VRELVGTRKDQGRKRRNCTSGSTLDQERCGTGFGSRPRRGEKGRRYRKENNGHQRKGEQGNMDELSHVWRGTSSGGKRAAKNVVTKELSQRGNRERRKEEGDKKLLRTLTGKEGKPGRVVGRL